MQWYEHKCHRFSFDVFDGIDCIIVYLRNQHRVIDRFAGSPSSAFITIGSKSVRSTPKASACKPMYAISALPVRSASIIAL